MAWWIPAIMAGTSILNSILGTKSAEEQAEAARESARRQADAAEHGINIQNQQWNQTRQDLLPYIQTGSNALSELNNVGLQSQFGTSSDPWSRYSSQSDVPSFQQFGIDPMTAYQQQTNPFQFDPTSDPSYQFRLQEGLDAVEGSAAAQGGLFSGQTGKDLTNYAQNAASQEYQKAFGRDLATKDQVGQAYGRAFGQNITGQQQDLDRRQLSNQEYYNALSADSARKQDAYNRIFGLAGMGMGGATQSGQFGQQSAGVQSQLAQNAAQAYGQGQIGSARAYGEALQNIGNQGQSLAGSLMNYQMYQNMLNQPQVV